MYRSTWLRITFDKDESNQLNSRWFSQFHCSNSGLIFLTLFPSSSWDSKNSDGCGYCWGSRYQDHCNCLTYTPPQLKMMLPSFDLQKMSRQVVRTHPPIVLLVLLSNILIFSLGSFSLGMPTFFYCVRAFYSAKSFVPFNGGKTFWLVMMVLR